MIDKYVILQMNVVIAVHDEASNMSKTVNPARIPGKAIVSGLKCHPCGSLKSLCI